MSGASLPTLSAAGIDAETAVLIPDEWGKSSDFKFRIVWRSSPS